MGVLKELNVDRQREKHYRNRNKKHLQKLESLRRAVLSLSPSYKFAVKFPHAALTVTERLTAPGKRRANYGSFTKLAWRAMKGHGSGTFDQLRRWAIENNLMVEDDKKTENGLRQAVYGLARRGSLETTVGRDDQVVIFHMPGKAASG